jgi:transcriptional regulator with XRE-family HTH domain
MEQRDIGVLIRERRVANGLSQEDLAKRLGISQPTVSMWERGRATPDPQQMSVLDNLLSGITKVEESEEESQTPMSAWLSRAMAKKDLTAPEVARRAGVSIPTIYNLLSGRAENPQARTLAAIERAVDQKFESSERSDSVPDSGGVGELIDFDPHDDSQIPGKGGVYVFYDIAQRPIYVGQATNIARRISDHKEKFWFRRPILEFGAYIEIQDKKLRNQVETVLIQFLKNNAVINKNKRAREDSN